jgi:excisionase family DNA binding protein
MNGHGERNREMKNSAEPKKRPLKKSTGSAEVKTTAKGGNTKTAKKPSVKSGVTELPEVNKFIYFTPVDEDMTIYTLEDVARILKVTRRTVYTYVNNKSLKAVKIGVEWRVKYQDLREFIQNLKYSD